MKRYVSIRDSAGDLIDDSTIPESSQGHLILDNFIKLI